MTGFKEMVNETGSNERGWSKRFLGLDITSNWQIQLEIQGTLDQIKEDIGNNQAIAVSDGSYQQDSSAAAWIIEGSTGANRIKGSMITPGTTGDHSSFRSKAAGIYGILLMLHALYDKTGYNQGRIDIACDGKLVLECLK